MTEAEQVDLIVSLAHGSHADTRGWDCTIACQRAMAAAAVHATVSG